MRDERMKMLKRFGKIAALTAMLAAFPTVSSAASFVDVSEKHGAKAEIEFLAEKKVIRGYEDGTFKPSKHVTKAQVATMLARALQLDVTTASNAQLTDVPKTHGSYKEISAIVNAGIMPGGEFKPYLDITRGEMAAALVNAFNLKGNGKITFSDVPANHPAAKVIDALATNGITRGYEDGTFGPEKPLQRAHFSSFLARVLEPSFIKTSQNSTTAGSKKPGTETISVNMNENYIYTYSTRTYVGADYWHEEELRSTGETADGWDEWQLTSELGGDYMFQTRDTDSAYEYTLPKADSALGHIYTIPYPLKKGTTWLDATGEISYEIIDVRESHRTKAMTFKNIYVIEATQNGESSLVYYANGFGEILTMSPNGDVLRELIRVHQVK